MWSKASRRLWATEVKHLRSFAVLESIALPGLNAFLGRSGGHFCTLRLQVIVCQRRIAGL